jgi:hypothetical protein
MTAVLWFNIAVPRLSQQRAAFPLPEGEVALSFPADLSVDSAKTMAAFANLLLKQAEQQAQNRQRVKDADGALNPGEDQP